MKKQTICSALTLVVLGETAQALELSLESCLTVPAQITDMTFVLPEQGLLTTQSGEIYWFQGCNQPVKKIGAIDVADSDWQLGLYSIATNWDFFATQQVFVYYASENYDKLTTRLSTFRLDISKAPDGFFDENVLLEIPQPYNEHNGGALRFGPDGLLYLGVGDGGSEGDPHGYAQNVHSILGSIVRIRPSKFSPKGYVIPEGNLRDFIPDAAPEIFAYGVRNPWKLTFNFKSDLIIADVGEHRIEEVDVITADMIGRQAINLGWNIKEGTECFNPSTDCSSEGLLDPVYQYEHEGNAGNSITGGETVRVGQKEYYLFADFVTGYLGVLDLANPVAPVLETTEVGKNWTTFGKSVDGRVYVVDYTGGEIYQVNLRP